MLLIPFVYTSVLLYSVRNCDRTDKIWRFCKVDFLELTLVFCSLLKKKIASLKLFVGCTKPSIQLFSLRSFIMCQLLGKSVKLFMFFVICFACNVSDSSASVRALLGKLKNNKNIEYAMKVSNYGTN